MGAFVAAGIYKLFKMLCYETANPGQDGGKEIVGLLYSDEESALGARGEVDLRCFQGMFNAKRIYIVIYWQGIVVKRPVGEAREGTSERSGEDHPDSKFNHGVAAIRETGTEVK